jgi:hypothetical protein
MLPAMPPRTPLSIGASTGTKVFFSIVGVFIALVGVTFALVGFGLAYGAQEVINSSGVEGDFHIDENGKLVPGPGDSGQYVGGALGIAGFGFMACSVVVALIAVFMVLRVVRTAAWLEGSHLFVRGALRTKSADLSISEISAGSSMQSVGAGDHRTYVAVHAITAVDPATNQKVSIPLKRGGATVLPGDQLSMLANAITNARTRKGEDDQAFVIAGRLRDFAADPFS